jgi:hypothetical protein
LIQIGQKIYCILYGGRYGVVYAIHGEQRPDSVQSIGGGVINFGGTAEFDIVFENGTETRRLPECILYGVQWKILKDEVVDAEKIAQMRAFVVEENARKDAEAKRKAEQFAADVKALREDPQYKYLEQAGQKEGLYSGKLAAMNIRRQLKNAFPDTKFSVRMIHDEIRISWFDGPSGTEVRAITDKYEEGHFDGMTDSYEYRTSPWTSVFGSSKYVNTGRKKSAAFLAAAVKAVCEEHGWPIVEVTVGYEDDAWVSLGDPLKDKILSDYIEHLRNNAVTVAAA